MSISESGALMCAEKARLLRLRAVAESHHQQVIQQVTWLLGGQEKPNYEDLVEFVEAAKTITNEAQEALDRHTAEHGC